MWTCSPLVPMTANTNCGTHIRSRSLPARAFCLIWDLRHKRTRLARTGSVVVHSDVGSGSGWLNDNGRERATIPVTTSGRGRNGASGGTDQLVWELCLPCDPETPAAAGEDRSGISLRENIHYENDTGRPQLTMVAMFPYGESWSVYI